MLIKRLQINQWRNYEKESFSFKPGIQLITGGNGEGKTNLLEAIYLVCMGFSPRTRKDGELAQWQTKGFSASCWAEKMEEPWQQQVRWKGSGSREVFLNEKKCEKISELMGKFPVVWCSPEDLSLVTGGPSLRRKFLDILLSQLDPFYLINLRDYQKVLKQRNALLKNPENYPVEVFETLSDQLVNLGLPLIEKREQFCEEFSVFAKAVYAEVSQGKEKLHIKYASPFSSEDIEGRQREFRSLLETKKAEEIRYGTSLYGPHRDNLLLLLSGRMAGNFGSQGQKRLISLSLRLAESEMLLNKHEVSPILLLDDVFAELDEVRRQILSELIAKKPQVFIASPRKSDLPFEVQNTFRIEKGRVV